MNIFDLAKIEIAEMLKLGINVAKIDVCIMAGILVAEDLVRERNRGEARFLELKNKYIGMIE